MEQQDLSKTFIKKIASSSQYFIIKSHWTSDDISLQIFDSKDSKEWTGVVTLEELKQAAEELEMSYERFYQECKEAIASDGVVTNFEYTIEGRRFVLTKNDEFRIRYLEIEMSPHCDSQHSLTISAVDLVAALRRELSAVKEESKGLNEKYQATVRTLDKCLEEKNLLESKLLQKFAVLLNSKKDKIAELQELLAEKDNKLEEAGLSGMEASKRKSTEMVPSGSDDEDFMISTQIMTQPPAALPKRKKLVTLDEPATRKASLPKGNASVSISIPQERMVEDAEEQLEIEDSPDIFDQI